MMSAPVIPLRPVFAIGIDPGPTTGIALLDLAAAMPSGLLARGAEIYQCNARSAPGLLQYLLAARSDGERGAAGIEGFAPGHGPGARRRPGRVTASAVDELAGICTQYGVPVASRYAGLVKPWAEGNDWKRLRACGLYDLTPGSAHARSAASQALYTAVHDCGWPDPLSRAAARTGGS
jgi:hypothetical protein